MSNERNNEEMDELVSNTYRELASENTPEHLDQAVLQLASGKAGARGTGNSLFTLWMKPAAWAATIGLSLAIVLEFTELPSPETVVVPIDAPPSAESNRPNSVQEEFQSRDDAILERAEARDRAQQSPSPVAVSEDEPVVEIDLSDVALKRKLNSYATSPSGIAQSAAREKVASEPAGREEAKKESDASNACDEQARESVENWLTCITQLRASGAIDAADREYEALIHEYPDETVEFESN